MHTHKQRNIVKLKNEIIWFLSTHFHFLLKTKFEWAMLTIVQHEDPEAHIEGY